MGKTEHCAVMKPITKVRVQHALDRKQATLFGADSPVCPQPPCANPSSCWHGLPLQKLLPLHRPRRRWRHAGGAGRGRPGPGQRRVAVCGRIQGPTGLMMGIRVCGPPSSLCTLYERLPATGPALSAQAHKPDTKTPPSTPPRQIRAPLRAGNARHGPSDARCLGPAYRTAGDRRHGWRICRKARGQGTASAGTGAVGLGGRADPHTDRTAGARPRPGRGGHLCQPDRALGWPLVAGAPRPAGDGHPGHNALIGDAPCAAGTIGALPGPSGFCSVQTVAPAWPVDGEGQSLGTPARRFCVAGDAGWHCALRGRCAERQRGQAALRNHPGLDHE